MGKVKVWHSLPRDLHAVQPRLSPKFSASLASGEKSKTWRQVDYYTGAPWQLLLDDSILFLQNFFYLKNIVLPLWNASGRAFPSGYLDELYPSLGNIHDIVFHSILIVTQSAFILSLPFLAALPSPVLFGYIGIFVAVNQLACWRLNGYMPRGVLNSTNFPECKDWKIHQREQWVFLNGVAVGKHWLQGNIDRISRTFHRPVLGVHNKTSGIIFDVIQCLLERCLYFGTTDTRGCFAIISDLLRDNEKKVILILHSQGGLEGSIILDWLMNQHSQEAMRRLEIYTFGNAANHFNDPRTLQDEESAPSCFDKRAVGHIEHYANSNDFVARWGVIHFKKKTAAQSEREFAANAGAAVYSKGTDHAHFIQPYTEIRQNDSVEQKWNSYHGDLFERDGSGHQLNQHYLDNMFPLDKAMKGVEVTEDGGPLACTFMDTEVDVINDPREMDKIRGKRRGYKNQWLEDGLNGVVSKHKVYQLSRLWSYTNGRRPEDCPQADMPIEKMSFEGRSKLYLGQDKNGKTGVVI
ncbi:hypothetical protein UCDDA912_g10440 [Diaporthe ampelina]|uniref:Alpha beta-hydrolase n=1 Tax=Diaporthe ampelina TaxID=1214573 RepID=A0A0G2F5Y5_9PEZI|nr:hypothetical protein UCDDA912_g10440 [Diaporthe ampelina]